MRATIIRDFFLPARTLGKLRLYSDTERVLFECFTLEDAARAFGVKIDKETAIPYGDYFLSITYSKRFDRPLPLVYNTPEMDVFDHVRNRWRGVRIHAGNTEKDTEGCILVGLSHSAVSLFHSQTALDELMKILTPAIAERGRIPLAIRNEQT